MRMRIVTLGHIGVGKTTYMASLYGELQQNFYGFTLETDKNEHTDLLSHYQAIEQGAYPSATARYDQYNFSLKFDGTEVLKFNWSDYPGGAIIRTKANQQAKLLLRDLQQSDGLMLMCDCEALVNGKFDEPELGRMIHMVTRALHGLSTPISLAIVFTKSDLVDRFDLQMLNHFRELIDLIEASDKVSGALIPVACGKQMINVPMPLFFALQAKMNYKANMLQRETASHSQKAKSLRDGTKGPRGYVDKISSWINKSPTKEELANAEEQQARSKEKEYQRIKPSLECINQRVQQLPLIQRGTYIEEYVEKLNPINNPEALTPVNNPEPNDGCLGCIVLLVGFGVIYWYVSMLIN